MQRRKLYLCHGGTDRLAALEDMSKAALTQRNRKCYVAQAAPTRTASKPENVANTGYPMSLSSMIAGTLCGCS